MSTIQQLPLAQLRISPRNARKTGGQSVADLAASIAAEGLLQNLVVTDAGNGQFDVEAGGRRLRALQLLQSEGRLPAALASVPCQVVDATVAGEASLAENTLREAMHPADQFDAFTALVDAGQPITEVASRFGVTDTFVKQRLRLARLRPQFLDMYRADEITLDQLQALATTDNHETQRQAWETARADWERSPTHLRSYIMREKVPSDSSLAQFVGLDAYRTAGGEVVQDLFSAKAWLADPALLDTLAMDKLEAKAATLRASGWAWTETWLARDWAKLREYGPLYEPNHLPFEYDNPADAARAGELIEHIAALEQRLDAEEAGDADPGVLDDLAAQLLTAEGEANEIDYRHPRAFPADTKATAGVIVSVDSGVLRFDYMSTRPGEKAPKAAHKSAGKTGTADADADTDAVPALPESLCLALSEHRNAVAVMHLLQDPMLAQCVLLERLLQESSIDRHPDNGLAIGCEGFCTAADTPDLHDTVRNRITAAARAITDVPMEGTLPWLLKQTDATRAQILAGLVALNFDGTTRALQGHPGVTAIQAITGFDMADHWSPTTDGFLAKVPGATIARAVTEARGKEAAAQLTGLKKAERVATAAKLLAGTGWLPEPLRGPTYGQKPAPAAKASQPKKAAKPPANKKAPAKKAPARKPAKAPAKPTRKPATKKPATKKAKPA